MNEANANPQGYVLALPERLAFYKEYANVPIMILGPEFDTDLSFWIVAGCEELMDLEKGINLSDFEQWVATNGHDRPAMEFNLLQKFTQHKDHVLNLFVDSDVNFVRLNRYRDILPFGHNRV